MKIIIFIISLMLYAANGHSREAGWVPIPKSPEINFGKIKKEKAKNVVPKSENSKSKLKKNKSDSAFSGTVYDNQVGITDAELMAFVDLLPKFRAWAKQQGEKAYPIVTDAGKPDFVYSAKAASWVAEHQFNDRRFFCIMGKMAAGMVIVEEGNDFKGTRPPDMPEVAPAELELVRRHMGELLNAGRNVPISD